MKPYDIKEYAFQLNKLISNESNTTKMGINAIHNTIKFSIEVIGKKWIKLFEDLSSKD